MSFEKYRTMAGYDVVIVGGGPGGVGAAVAAGRTGAKTLLVEREGCLGGGMTTMLVNPFMPYTTTAGPNNEPAMVVNGGLFTELCRKLERFRGQGCKQDRCFDDEGAKVVLDELVADAGVEVLFHAALFDTQVADGRVQAALLAHNGGPICVSGKVFIDATGDALLAERAGCQIMFGDEEGKVMPMTLNFIVGGVDMDRMTTSGQQIKAMTAAGGNDSPPLINTNFSCWSWNRSGFVHFNAIRVGGSTIDPVDVSHAEMEARRRVENYVAWLRAKVPAFAQCFLVKTGSHIGIRESRRVLGDYVLCGEDFNRCARFDDAIACCSYDVDIHGQQQGQTTIVRLPPGGYYQIPYRCLTPKGVTNLLVAARSISTDVRMHSSVRIIPPVMNIGQAAGTAAAMSLSGGDVRKIDIRTLQDSIRAAGGILEPELQPISKSQSGGL